MDREFDLFFRELKSIQKTCESDEGSENLLKPLKILILKQQLKSILLKTLIITTICFSIYYVDSFNWYFCSVGRILMIKILPFWDWTKLETSKCLIMKPQVDTNTSNKIASDFTWKDCRACQNFDMIEALDNTNYQEIHEEFLIRGLPVIVKDSIAMKSSSVTLEKFLRKMRSEMSEIITSRPCSLETNLMMSQYAQLDGIFSSLEKRLKEEIAPDAMSPWFFSFRNCNFQALKASRLMVEKPYFYPRSLQAPASSWILVSGNFSNYSNDLSLVGLVIVTQIEGELDVSLTPREECRELCQKLNLKLFAGESLVYLHHLWTFSYRYVAEKSFTLTFITETDFYE